jgi:beta-lactamase superfamily II metal-dependent hydrolase
MRPQSLRRRSSVPASSASHRAPFRLLACAVVALVLAASAATPLVAFALGNGKLQIHHVNVDQGDGILLISPLGQTALFDDGNYLGCTGIKTYLQGLGITVVDYHFASHYHSDHVGCIDDLAAIGITIGTAGYDRGYTYSSGVYTAYTTTLGAKRQTITQNQVITLDAGSATPVLLKCVNLNGAGVYSPTGSDENAKSVVMLVSYGNFNEVIAGDLTGDGATDVETTIGPQVGDVEVYKVHHHGSAYSSNDNWLTATTPEVGIIQVGDGNSYGHPTSAALTRLHNHGVSTYWTETGAGAAPNPTWDTVANGAVVVQADPGAGAAYTVSGAGFADTWYNDGGTPPPPPIPATEVAEGIVLTKGTITTGDYTRLAANDASRVSIGAGVTSGKYLTDWYGTVTLDHPPLNLAITYDGNYTVSRTQTMWLWNWTTSAWVQINQSTVSTSDVGRTWSTGTPAAYVSATREVRLRVSTNTRTSSFTCRGDYMAFAYDYTSGTMRVPAPVVYASAVHPITAAEPVADAHLAEGGAERPLSALRSIEAVPGANGADLTWSISVNDHVDGFNVYRVDGAGERVFAGNEASFEVADGVATFQFHDPLFTGGATYWLGARGCSGPEGLIGPLVVGASAAGTDVALAPTLALAAWPNPVVSSLRVSFSTPGAGHARIDVYDAAGRHIATPFAGMTGGGMQEAAWDLAGARGKVAPGVYFLKLQVPERTLVKRVVVGS